MAGCREHSRVYDDRGGKLLRKGGDTYEASCVYAAIFVSWHPNAGPDLGSVFRCYPPAISLKST